MRSCSRATSAALPSAVPWILRLSLAGCYAGHGAFGVITKAAWLPFFGVLGIPAPWAWRLMPWVGICDIAIGLGVLLWPCRAFLAWAVLSWIGAACTDAVPLGISQEANPFPT